jgi:steroid delta-isomerase-like uncharacterized protein/uncharacterized protein (TIGR02246 family)
MRRTIVVSALGAFGALLLACGPGNEENPPPKPPPVASVTTPPPPPPPPSDTTPPPPPPKPSMAEMQKTAMETAQKALNAHDAKAFASVFADNTVVAVAGLNELQGRDAVEQNMKEWFETFKNIKLGFRRVWMKGDVVALEWVINGTHSGELFGVKGKENPIGHYGLSLVWFDQDGKVKRENRYGELGTVLTQTGAAKGAKPKEIPTIPATAEVIVGKGTPDEDKLVDAAKAAQGTLAKKSEADFLGAITDDVEYEGVLFLDQVKGKNDAKKLFAGLTKAFPDMQFAPTTTMGVGEYAIVEYTMSGTQKGALGALPASKKPVTVHLVDIYKFKDGKIARAWTYQNTVELMTQVGALTPPNVTPPANATAPASTTAPKK